MPLSLGDTPKTIYLLCQQKQTAYHKLIFTQYLRADFLILDFKK